MELGEYLRKYDVSMADFARRIGSCQQTISAIANGTSKGCSLLLAHAIVGGTNFEVRLDNLPINEKTKLILQKYELEKRIAEISRADRMIRKTRKQKELS